jgi:hypothetical protein
VSGLLTFIGVLIAIWLIALVSHVVPLVALIYGTIAVVSLVGLFRGVPGD